MIDVNSLIRESATVGLAYIGIINGEPSIIGDQTLASLVIAAHGKTSTDAEIIALKAHLGAESAEWAAYVEARKAPTRAARQARYRDETDALRLKADEDFTIGSEDWLAAIEAWKAAKAAIRAEFPYEVE